MPPGRPVQNGLLAWPLPQGRCFRSGVRPPHVRRTPPMRTETSATGNGIGAAAERAETGGMGVPFDGEFRKRKQFLTAVKQQPAAPD